MARSKLKKGKCLASAQQEESLRKFLTDTGHSYSSLARMAKMHPSAFSRFMRGETHGSVDMIQALSGAMGIDLWEACSVARAPDPSNMVTAANQLGYSVSTTAVDRVRLLVRLPVDLPDAPVEWWSVRIMLEEQIVQHHAKLDALAREQAKKAVKK